MSTAPISQWMIRELPAQAAADPIIRLPASPRRLGGEFAVAEAASRLTRFFGFHHGLMRALAGRLATLSQLDLKIEIAHHIYLHAEACRTLRERIGELRAPPPERSGKLDALTPLFREIEAAPCTPALVLATHETIGRRLLAAEINYALRTDALADEPSLRVLSRIAAELEPAVDLGGVVLAGFREAGWSSADSEVWIQRVRAHLSALGGVTGDDRPTLAPSMAPRYLRPTVARRDPRFKLAAGVSGNGGDEPGDGRPRSEHERQRLALLRSQRDRQGAMETFASLLYDLPEAPFEWQMDLARFQWDEARHAEIGHQALRKLGHDPFELVPGAAAGDRGPVAPTLAFEQISAFVELEVDSHLRSFVERARAAGDREHAMVFDFIDGDQMLHLHRGGAWRRTALSRHPVARSGGLVCGGSGDGRDGDRPSAAPTLAAPIVDDLEETLEP